MARYEIRIQSPDGSTRVSWDVERADDEATLNSAVEVCQKQVVEIWNGNRQVAAISPAGTPRVTL